MARHGEAVAAVVACAADDRGALAVGEVLEDRVDDGDRGVLHQDDRRDAEAFDRAAIDLLHFFRGEDLHSRNSAATSPALSSAAYR